MNKMIKAAVVIAAMFLVCFCVFVVVTATKALPAAFLATLTAAEMLSFGAMLWVLITD